MRFDTVIIGGGLSGLVCGLRLLREGKKCAIVSAGQNAMHFFSGGFGLLSRMQDGSPVSAPLDAVGSLPAEHPYRKIGKERISAYACEAEALFASCGIGLVGSAQKNSYIISATGAVKPVWLAVDDMAVLESPDEKIGDKVLIAGIDGFLDFNSAFLALALEKRGCRCRIVSVTTEVTGRLRKNPSEMRASNIARLMSAPEALQAFADGVRERLEDEDCIVLPAVFGLESGDAPARMRAMLGRKTVFVGTLPPSVPGIRSQMLLKKAYDAAGGVFLKGDEVTGADVLSGRVSAVVTANLGDERLYADDFVLAPGSFYARGLMAGPDGVYEPVLGLDVIADEDRGLWYDRDFFRKQNFIGYGVRTDESFRVSLGGVTLANMYAAGSVLGGCNPLYEGSGAGVAVMTAMRVSDIIAKSGSND